MLKFRIQRGVRFIASDGQQWTIDRTLVSRRILLLNDQGVVDSMTHEQLMNKWRTHEWVIDSRSIECHPDVLYQVTKRDLSAYSESDQAQAKFKFEFIEPLLPIRRLTDKAIEDRCRQFKNPCNNKPISARTARRWIQTYRGSRCSITSLIDRREGKKVNETNDFLELFERIIHERYLIQERVLRSDIVAKLQEELCKLNASRAPDDQLKVPSDSTLFRRLRDLDAYIVDRAKYGADYANNKHRVANTMVRTTGILERVEIDHARLDIILVDPYTGIVLSRPWLTIAVDHYSKMILGFHLSLDPPNAQSILQCLAHSVLPKDEILRRYPDIKGEWPAAGLWHVLAMDNGMDMHANILQKACLQLGTHILFCPRKKPWFKAVVERACRDVNGVMHQLPGTTFSNPKDRKDYKSGKYACLDLETLEHILVKWIVSIHNTKPYRKKHPPRIERWKTSQERFGIELPESAAALQLLVAPTTTRTLFHYGVEFENIQYNSPALQDLRRQLQKNVEGNPENAVVPIRFHDHTVEYVEVLDERAGHYIRVYARDIEYAKDLTRFMHRLIGRQLQEKYGNKSGEADRREAREQMRELVNEARRRHQRNLRALAKTPLLADQSTYREIAKSSSSRGQLALSMEQVDQQIATSQVMVAPDEDLFAIPQLPVPHLSISSLPGAIQ